MKKFIAILLLVVSIVVACFLGFKTDWYRDWSYYKSSYEFYESNDTSFISSNISSSNTNSSNITNNASYFDVVLNVSGEILSENWNGEGSMLGYKVESGQTVDIWLSYFDSNGNPITVSGYDISVSYTAVNGTEVYMCDYRMLGVLDTLSYEDFILDYSTVDLLPDLDVIYYDNSLKLLYSKSDSYEYFDDSENVIYTLVNPVKSAGYACNAVWQYNGIEVTVTDMIIGYSKSIIIYSE